MRSPGCTGAGEAWEIDDASLPEQVQRPVPPLRALTVRGCDSPGPSEPYPVSTTDASGAPLVRQDTPPIAKVRIIVKNKERT